MSAGGPKCPHCGSSAGYDERLICRLRRWRSFDGDVFDSEVSAIRGGTVKHCVECRRDITKFVTELQKRTPAG